MLSIYNGRPRKLHHFKTVSVEEINQLQQDYQGKKITEEELFWSYHTLFVEGIDFPKNKDWETIWKKLTLAQKNIIVLGHFIGQTNNGGVWQFIFNRTDYTIAALDTFCNMNLYILPTDYKRVVEEFGTMLKSGKFQQIIEIWNQGQEETMFQAFNEGRELLPSAKEIEEYFYTDKFKRVFFAPINEYIQREIVNLVQVDLPQEQEERKVIKKKEAIPYFSAYIKEVYGEEPEEVKVYYTGRVTIGNQPTQLYLMHYKLPSGYESIGITGYFTLHLENAPMVDINKLQRRYHKQELVNLYHGYYLVKEELAKNPKANKVNVQKWEKRLANLQDPSENQIPVNVSLVDYLRFGKKDWYIFTGDLLYNSEAKVFPSDLSNVNLSILGDKEYRGEPNLIFFSGDKKDYGRSTLSNKQNIILMRYYMYYAIGLQTRLLKDNPWG